MNAMLDMHQVAERLGTSHRHVRRLVHERRIEFVHVGGKVRFEHTAVEAWLRANTVPVADR